MEYTTTNGGKRSYCLIKYHVYVEGTDPLNKKTDPLVFSNTRLDSTVDTNTIILNAQYTQENRLRKYVREKLRMVNIFD